MTCPGQYTEEHRTCDSCIGNVECENMSDILLTAGELALPCMDTKPYGDQVARAQLAKTIAWLFDDCTEEHGWGGPRWQCPRCRQALKESVK